MTLSFHVRFLSTRPPRALTIFYLCRPYLGFLSTRLLSHPLKSNRARRLRVSGSTSRELTVLLFFSNATKSFGRLFNTSVKTRRVDVMRSGE